MAQTGISDIVYTGARHDRVSTGTLDDKALEALGWRPEARWLVFWRGRIAFPATGPTPDPTREPEPLSPLLLDGPTVRGLIAGRTTIPPTPADTPPALAELVAAGGDGLADLTLAPPAPPPVTGPSHPTLHLGLLDGAALQVIDLSALPERPPTDAGEAGESDLAPDLRLADGSAPVFRELRGVALAVEDAMAGAMAHAQALLNWHASHPLCPRCGAVTRIAAGGRHRHCANPACGADHFPRTDPVVIMLVEDPEGERCLLARQSRFPAGMYSALAGFVEPGETLEAAVAREVREEAGLDVGDIRYVASQPWPWPSNLMIGFIARARATALSLDDNELEDARWFTRAEVAAMGEVGDEGEGFRIPRRDAIARHLVEGWRDRRF